MSELVRQDSYAASPLQTRMQYAGTLAHAGDLIPTGLRTQGQPSQGKILLVMETGAMLGIHPVAALQGVHVIEGKATISPALMSALVRRAGHTLRIRMTGSFGNADGDLKATATLIRSDDPENPFEVTWDIPRAKRASLIPGKSGSAWAKYPEAMLKARAISEVCREGATDVLMGVGYVPEEMGANVNEAGEVLDFEQVRPDGAGTPQEPAGAPETPQAPQGSPEPSPTPQTAAEHLPEGLYDLGSITDLESCRQTFRAARTAGHLGHLILVPIEGTDDHEEMPFGQWLTDLGTALGQADQKPAEQKPAEAETLPEPSSEDVVDAEIVE